MYALGGFLNKNSPKKIQISEKLRPWHMNQTMLSKMSQKFTSAGGWQTIWEYPCDNLFWEDLQNPPFWKTSCFVLKHRVFLNSLRFVQFWKDKVVQVCTFMYDDEICVRGPLGTRGSSPFRDYRWSGWLWFTPCAYDLYICFHRFSIDHNDERSQKTRVHST